MSNQRYDIKKHNLQHIDFQLLYISTSKYEADWVSIPHTHSFVELFYIIDGQGAFYVEDYKLDVKKDDIVVMNPEMSHTERSFGKKPLEYIVLGIDGLIFGFGDDMDSFGCSAHNFREHRNEIMTYLEILLKEIRNDSDDSELICNNIFEVLLLMLIRRTSYSMEKTEHKRAGRECGMAKRFLDENYKQSLTLDDLANHTHTNKYYLAHSFTKTFGVSPINYLLQKRLEESRSLLTTTDYSVTQIASMLGFSSPSYFSQAFSKAHQESPNKYRKKNHISMK